MKYEFIKNIVLSLSIFTLIFAAFSCSNTSTGESGEVIDAYKELYAAVQSKDTERIKKMMSGATLQFVEGVAAQRNKPVSEILENGLYASTINPELPEIRDQRIKEGKFGAVEVFVKKTGKYEQAYFINEITLYIRDIGPTPEKVVSVIAEATKLEPEKAKDLIGDMKKPLFSTVEKERALELQKKLNEAGAKTEIESGWKVAVGDLFAGTFQNPEQSKAQKEAQASNKMIPLNPNVNGNPTNRPIPKNPAGANSNIKVKTIEIPPTNAKPQPKPEDKK